MIITYPEINSYRGRLDFIDITNNTFKTIFTIDGVTGSGSQFGSQIRILKTTVKTIDIVVQSITKSGIIDSANLHMLRILKN